MPHREQQTLDSRRPRGPPSLSPSAPCVPPAGAEVRRPPAALSSRPPRVTPAVPRGSRAKSATLTRPCLLPPASPPLPAPPRRACPASLHAGRVSFETPFVLSHKGPRNREKTQEDRSDTGFFRRRAGVTGLSRHPLVQSSVVGSLWLLAAGRCIAGTGSGSVHGDALLGPLSGLFPCRSRAGRWDRASPVTGAGMAGRWRRRGSAGWRMTTS